jgi:hypothetical protein
MEKILIYVIITVILILTSVRKGKKQKQDRLEQMKKRKDAEEMQQTSQSDPLNEIFKRLSSDFFEEPQQTPVQEDVFSEMASKKPDPFLNYELQKMKSAQKPKRKVSKIRQNYLEEEKIEIGKLEDELPEFVFTEPETVTDWKKAIIYSEIINRKYV